MLGGKWTTKIMYRWAKQDEEDETKAEEKENVKFDL